MLNGKDKWKQDDMIHIEDRVSSRRSGLTVPPVLWWGCELSNEVRKF